MSDQPLKIRIKCKGQLHVIHIFADQIVLVLKRLIANVTKIKPSDQVFRNLDDDLMNDNNLPISDIQHILTVPGFIVRVDDRNAPGAAGSDEPQTSSAEEFEPQPGTSRQLELDYDYEEPIETPIKKTPPAKFLFSMKKKPKDRKLLILDIDNTLYDDDGLATKTAKRPYLQEFLKTVRSKYNIAIWSATTQDFIDEKLKHLGMFKNSDYPIAFCLDVNSTSLFEDVTRGYQLRTKPLRIVWEQFPQYTKKNTVMVDDNEAIIKENAHNGILIESYDYNNFGFDRVLLLLKQYLMDIADSEDLSALDHSGWMSKVDLDVESPTTSSGCQQFLTKHSPKRRRQK